MSYFVHPNGLCESPRIGAGTRVWAFAHVLPGARIGNDCNICDGVFVENDVTIGNRVTIKCGVQLWDGTTLEDGVFVGPNATFTNDRHPRSKAYPGAFLRTVVERDASIGANATVLPGLRIGRNAMVGAGAVVTRSVPPNAIVAGNPARIIGYAGAEIAQTAEPVNGVPPSTPRQSHVRGVHLCAFHAVTDLRGSLSVGEFEREIPFAVKRYFLVYDVPSIDVRGEHAHHQCHQFLIAARGSVHVVADDGDSREEFTLDRPNLGLYLPPMTWGVQYKYSDDALLLVFASHSYDPDDYIREYDQFIELARQRTETGRSLRQG